MKISIIIPAINEAKSLSRTLSFLKADGSDFSPEIIVSDGGSTDNSREVVEKSGCIFHTAPQKGRSIQMNEGARISSGDILYFLHADTLPPKGFLVEIIAALENGYDAGCFKLSFDYPHPLLKSFSWFTQFDVDFFRFGDQSLFIKKPFFDEINRFDEKLLVMEDQEIVQRIKRYGRFTISKSEVTTSARKYQKIGVLRLQMLFTLIFSLYYLGVKQQTLLSLYKELLRFGEGK